MSSSPTQPDPKEAVEAQLCAYLEGDLSPEERASIEQHLVGNPPHQQLLADLAEHRQWLRELPREPAPADVGEAFQQQVERSLLLGDEPARQRRKSTGRLPQFMMMAALVLLTAGLGVGLTLMLARPDRSRGRLAASTPMSPTVSVDRDPIAPAPGRATTQPSPPLAAAAPAMAAASNGAIAMRKAATPAPEAIAIGGGGVRGAPDTDALTVPAQSLFVRVTPADPAAVDSVLAKNGLTLDSTTGAALSSRDRLASTGAQYAADEPAATQEGQQAQLFQSRQSKIATNSVAKDDSQSNGARRYVARGLTVDQAKHLTDELKAAAGPGRVTVATNGPTTQPDARIAAGELVTVVIPQLTGAGVGQANTVRVSDDGTIALPMLDPLPAAGATREALAHRIADRYRQANLIANPTVTVVTTVTPAATQPTTVLRSVTVDVYSAPRQKK